MNELKKPLLALAAVFSFVFLAIFLYNRGLFLPRWIVWQEKEQDLHGGELSLHQRTLTWRKDNRILWQSPPGWYVSDAAVSDFDSDGNDEVLFLVWRKGNYGSSHPFWEEPDNDGFYQHLYIFEAAEETLERQWMSSALLPQIHAWQTDAGRMTVTDEYGETSVWIWQGFGVVRIA